MKPALAENGEEKERKHRRKKKKSLDNLFPDSQHEAKSPAEGRGCRISLHECQAGVLPALAPGPQGLLCCTKHKTFPGSGFCHFWRHLPWEHPLLPLSVLTVSISSPPLVFHSSEISNPVLELKGTTCILVILTQTCSFPCCTCKQEPSGFSYHCYFS